MADLSREYLERPPEETSRRLALLLLEEAAGAAERLERSEDPEALHDFRVGLRRLRTCLRAYRPYLKASTPRKLRGRLKALADSTNEARDTEIQLAWVEPQIDQLAPEQRVGVQWLVERWKARQVQVHNPSLRAAVEEFGSLRRQMAERLAVCEIRLDPEHDGPRPFFLSVTGRLIAGQSQALERDLSGIRGVTDDAGIHASRISGKRLRYLIEPLREETSAARALVKRLKGLQDLLGDLHDTKTLEDDVSSALETSAVDRARRLHEAAIRRELPAESGADDWEERHGLLELLRLLKERRERLFARLEAEFLHGHATDLFARVEAFGHKLASGLQPRPSRRRFVLTRLPDRARSAPCSFIDEGWLAGKANFEVLRRVRTGRRRAYSRFLKPEGSSGQIEEPISRKYFATLWPLTERRRLRMRTYEISDDPPLWRIHDFQDRTLILAEVEPPPGESEVSFPDWLSDCVDSEVTGSPSYEGAALFNASAPRREAKPRPRRRKKESSPSSPTPEALE